MKDDVWFLAIAIATATYLIFRTNVLKGTDLLLSHCRHDSHHKVFPISEPIFNLYTRKHTKIFNQYEMHNLSRWQQKESNKRQPGWADCHRWEASDHPWCFHFQLKDSPKRNQNLFSLDHKIIFQFHKGQFG